MHELIEFTGITGYIMMWVTVLLGLFVRKFRILWARPSYRFIAATASLILTTACAIIIMFKERISLPRCLRQKV
jgi:hypothetical protein